MIINNIAMALDATSKCDEMWTVVSYPGVRKDMYMISSKGKIKNLKTNRLLSPYLHKSGYLYINLMSDEMYGFKPYVFRLHRLVAYAFVARDSNDKIFVNHIDGNKTNPDYTNLEWVTFSENMQHAFKTGLFKSRKGELSSNAKINKDDAIVICKMLIEFNGNISDVIKNMRVRYNKDISYSLIFGIKRKYSWTEISDKYFNNEYFTKNRNITDEEVIIICEILNACNGNVAQAYEKITQFIPGVHIAAVYRIRNKTSHKKIVEEYLNDFS